MWPWYLLWHVPDNNVDLGQVWAGEEDCEDVTWEECKLEKKSVPFEVPEFICDACEKVGPASIFVLALLVIAIFFF